MNYLVNNQLTNMKNSLLKIGLHVNLMIELVRLLNPMHVILKLENAGVNHILKLLMNFVTE